VIKWFKIYNTDCYTMIEILSINLENYREVLP